LSPTAWTVVGFLLALCSGFSFWAGGYRGELFGGLLILASGFFDVLDGAAARAMGKVSKVGGFLDSVLDRVAEVAIFLGVLAGGYAPPSYVLLALSFSLLVSYARARGDALGVDLSGIGIGERSERLIVLALSSLLGLVYYGVILVAVLAGFTLVERVYRAVLHLR